MRAINLLTAVMVAGLVASPAFAQSSGGGSEAGGGAGSNQVHCSAAKNANAAADPNCQQRDPPMPAPGSAMMQPSTKQNSTSQR
jgi:hypothetical protein